MLRLVGTMSKINKLISSTKLRYIVLRFLITGKNILMTDV